MFFDWLRGEGNEAERVDEYLCLNRWYKAIFGLSIGAVGCVPRVTMSRGTARTEACVTGKGLVLCGTVAALHT